MNSEIIAGKLFQIIFNTHEFIESQTNGSADKTNQLTKKIKKLILTEMSKVEPTGESKKNRDHINEFSLVTGYYLKLSQLKEASAGQPQNSENLSHFLSNGYLTLQFYVFLNSLFRKNQSHYEQLCEEKHLKKLERILLENFEQIYAIYSSEANRKKLSADEELLLGKITFNMLNLIDSIVGLFTLKGKSTLDFVKKLFDLLKKCFWLQSSYVKTTSTLNETALSQIGNALALSRLLIRLLGNNKTSVDDVHLKQEIFLFFKHDNFLQLVSLVIVECTQNEYECLAHEIVHDLATISKKNSDSSYVFSFENFVKHSQKAKAECMREHGNNVQVAYPIAVNNAMASNRANFLAPTKSGAETSLTKLFDFYDHKIREQTRQQTQMMNTLNECFSKSLMAEVEQQTLRGIH